MSNTIPCQTMGCGADCDQDHSVVYCYKCWEAAGKPRRTETGNSKAAIDRVEIETLRDENAKLREAVRVLGVEAFKWRAAAEDTHDQNYGFCRDDCTKCAAIGAAWNASGETDANALASAAIEEAKR